MDEQQQNNQAETNPTPEQPAASEQNNQGAQEAEQKRMLVGILSYLSILVIIAYILGKDDPRLHFHIKQGVVLFVAGLATFVIMSMIPILFFLASIVQVVIVIYMIIGIINVVQKKDKELPLIGHLATHVPL